MRVNKKIKTLTFFCTTLVLCLFAAEFAVRIWAPQELISDVLTLDQMLCHRLKSNVEGVQNSREFSVEITTNSIGVRDRDYSAQKPEGTFRILMLGDSHTLGWGVNLEESFTKVLEHSLIRNSDSFPYQVINCGMYGYGTAHQYQFLKKTGYNLKPDMVIIAMDFLHDIRVNNDGYFYFEGEDLVRSAKTCFAQKSRSVTRYIPLSSYLRGHSHLFRYTGVSLQRLRSKLFDNAKAGTNTGGDEEIDSLKDTQRIFIKVKQELQSRGIEFRVVILPEFNSIYQTPRSNPLFFPLLNSFQEFLTKERINYLSLQNSFERHPSLSTLTFKYSHHFTPKGHQFIAEQIEQFLQKKANETITKGI